LLELNPIKVKEGGRIMIEKKSKLFPILVVLTYFVMLATNAAAVLLPINGLTTQEVSDTFPNLFAPAGITFSIWSVIYLLLAFFVVYQWRKPDRNSLLADAAAISKIRIIFISTSILNSVWLFVWQYLQIDLSMVIMLALLLALIYANLFLKKATVSKKDYFFIRLPFSVYFGWITIATIANAAALLVDKKLAILQNNQPFWTVVVLVVGALIICTTIISNHNVAYGLATIWAYFGILIKHQSKDGWNHQYPTVIFAVIVCLVVIAFACIYQLYVDWKRK
jgi:hypothetical protein